MATLAGKTASTTPPQLGVPLGIAGFAFATIMLTSLWTLTTHRAAWENANLLVFNPLAFAMLGAAWRTRKPIGASPLARTLVAIQLCPVFLGWLLHWVPGLAQQNLPWLLFTTPVWLAIAWVCVRKRPRAAMVGVLPTSTA